MVQKTPSSPHPHAGARATDDIRLIAESLPGRVGGLWELGGGVRMLAPRCAEGVCDSLISTACWAREFVSQLTMLPSFLNFSPSSFLLLIFFFKKGVVSHLAFPPC